MESFTIIKPKKTFSFNDIKELWKYKELLYFFTWRDLKVRYKQTFVGAGWAIFQPFITMFVFTIFSKLANIPSDGVPYPIFVYTGLLFWHFFQRSQRYQQLSYRKPVNRHEGLFSALDSATVFRANQTRGFRHFRANFNSAYVLLRFCAETGKHFVIPIVLAISFMASVGLGLTLAAVNVKYRDVRYALPFSFKCFSLSPRHLSREYCRKIFVAACSESNDGSNSKRPRFPSRHNTDKLGAYRISFAACAVLLIIGVYVFKKIERYFADII